ncbi:DUF4760 domain-containing protein [Cognatiluteimonas profundi]|uniref:DUF4760 domain-containing protein n=1 Tax=Cognatiluteimonas profundi TaxID=2594501 RepID=UPI00131E2303|nr:DUF4760 domain-containing protein [Lysobacter profundi]
MATTDLMAWLNLLVSALTLIVFVVSIRFLGRQITEQQRQIAQQQLQIEKADQQVSKEHDWNRRKAVVELSLDYSSIERMDVRRRLERYADWYDPMQDYDTLAAGQQREIDADLKQVLNYLEGIAVAIKHNVYDRDIAYEFLGAHVPAVYRWSKPWIDRMRAHAGDASILEAVETLSAQWELRNRDLAQVLDTPTWREGKAPT